MRNYLKISALFLAGVIITSCEEERVNFNGQAFVMFDDAKESTVSVPETIGTINLPIVTSVASSTDLTVNFEITSEDAVAGEDYTVASSSVIIPAGEFGANLVINVVDNEVFNSAKSLTITLTGNSGDLQLGIADAGSLSKTIVITNDDFDCPTDFNFWLGDLSLEDVGFATTAGIGYAADVCDELTVEGNLPGDDTAGNRTFVLKFEAFGNDSSAGTVTVEPTFVRQITSGGTTYDAMYVGEGTYDTSTGEIVIEYSFSAFLGGVEQGYFWTGTTIITLAD